jgi:DNA primase
LISRNTIDRVFDAARVEEVIGEFVQLKKAGSNFKGLSPFSDERTPSFMVSPVKQIWKDFSSGKGGNVVTFLMEHEHYSYPEAIRYLAKKYNIEVEETRMTSEEKQQADERESMYLVSEFARDYFQRILWEDDQGKALGLSYFKERGYTDEIIRKFQLGYSLDSWEGFTREALNSGYELKYLEATGLTIVKQDLQTESGTREFDRFKGRVMFPIHSMSGRVLGFGGRILSEVKKAAKYLNSPESSIYHKSDILYGIYYSKQAIAKEDTCYLVEGYTDVISLHQAGIENVVSSSGTALTANQIRLINRLTRNITILFDGDAAGIRASFRGIDLILEQGMNVKVVIFPDGEDPDSYAKKVSKVELKDFLEDQAQDFINFKVSVLMDEASNDPVKKAGLIRDIVTSISKIPDRIQREVYLQECARVMDISEEVLFSELAQLLKKERREAARPRTTARKPDPVLQKTEAFKPLDELKKYEREIIRILLLYGNQVVEFTDEEEIDEKKQKVKYENVVANEIYVNLQEDEVEFTDELFRTIYYEIIEQLNQDQEILVDGFINHHVDEVAHLVTNILMDDERYQLHDWNRKNIFFKIKGDDLTKTVKDAVYNLRRVLIDSKIESLKANVAENQSEGMELIKDYIGLKVKLSQRLSRVV